MKLRALEEFAVDGIDHVKDDVFECLPEQGIDLIRLGMAEEVVEPTPD